jgi:uncharacterized membrane protein YeaQ/YmgE (transglycosylase-associated protein family)
VRARRSSGAGRLHGHFTTGGPNGDIARPRRAFRHPQRGGNRMGIIIWLIVGGIVGWLASIIMKRDAQQGIILNIVVGIVGADRRLDLRRRHQSGHHAASFAYSLIGAVILLAIVNLFTRKSIR